MLFQSVKETISFKDSLHSFSTWTNYETPHDQALMLVAACQDFLTLSGVDKSVPLLLQFQAWMSPCSDAANKWQCRKKWFSGETCNMGLSETMTNGLNAGFLVTPVALDRSLDWTA